MIAMSHHIYSIPWNANAAWIQAILWQKWHDISISRKCQWMEHSRPLGYLMGNMHNECVCLGLSITAHSHFRWLRIRIETRWLHGPTVSPRFTTIRRNPLEAGTNSKRPLINLIGWFLSIEQDFCNILTCAKHDSQSRPIDAYQCRRNFHICTW